MIDRIRFGKRDSKNIKVDLFQGVDYFITRLIGWDMYKETSTYTYILDIREKLHTNIQ